MDQSRPSLGQQPTLLNVLQNIPAMTRIFPVNYRKTSDTIRSVRMGLLTRVTVKVTPL